jgi:23S rRNA (cytosine1962-C5)-methyltransferase
VSAGGAEPYQLLDSGGGRKLERVGEWIVDRTAPQALWKPTRGEKEWAAAHAVHHRSEAGGGHWEKRVEMPERWPVATSGVTLLAKLTPFGHLGLFAEHGSQWQVLRDAIAGARARSQPVEVLNLFAYTGGATLACAQAGASVCHVDAAKGVVDWARDNARLGGLEDRPVRWIVDDCAAFLAREKRRGHRYQALILDPPSFGRSGRGKVWKIEDGLPVLLALCAAVLDEEPLFVLLSCHSAGLSPLALENLLAEHFDRPGSVTSGEMAVLEAASGRSLPSGVFTRWMTPPRR